MSSPKLNYLTEDFIEYRNGNNQPIFYITVISPTDYEVNLCKFVNGDAHIGVKIGQFETLRAAVTSGFDYDFMNYQYSVNSVL